MEVVRLHKMNSWRSEKAVETVPNHLLSLYFVSCSKHVTKLVNNLVMVLLGSRLGGTRVHMTSRTNLVGSDDQIEENMSTSNIF